MSPRLGPGLAVLLMVSGAAAADYPCASGGFMPVNDGTGTISRETALFMLMVPIGGLYRDNLADTPKVSARLRVVDAAGKPVAAARSAALHVKSGRFLGAAKGAEATLVLPEGDYDFNALIPDRPLRWGTARGTLTKPGGQTIAIRLDQTSAVGTAGAVAPRIVGGAEFTVGWSGERPPGAHFYIVKTRSGKREIVSETEVGGAAGDFTATAPFATGIYEAVLSVCAPDYTLARWTLNVAAPMVALSAPPTAPGGSEVVVAINRPQVDDESLAFETLEGSFVRSASLGDRVDATTFRIRAPLGGGDYRLVYTVGSETVARLPIRIGAANLDLKAPEKVRFAEPFPVALAGGKDDGVRIEIWSTGAKPRLVAEDLDFDEVRILGEPGSYEIRAVEQAFETPKILARTRITLEAGPVIAEAPKTAARDEEIRVRLVYPIAMDDIRILRRGHPSADDFVRRGAFEVGGVVALEAPSKPGAYDIVYTASNPAGFGIKILARQPLDVR